MPCWTCAFSPTSSTICPSLDAKSLLGRYTHRVAIANSRLTQIGDSTVSSGWKDYRYHDRRKVMTLK